MWPFKRRDPDPKNCWLLAQYPPTPNGLIMIARDLLSEESAILDLSKRFKNPLVKKQFSGYEGYSDGTTDFLLLHGLEEGSRKLSALIVSHGMARIPGKSVLKPAPERV